MDKLTPQTVYVPVAKNADSDYSVNQWVTDEWRPVENVKGIHDVYPLTGEQIESLLDEFGRDIDESGEWNPQWVKNFLKSKGVNI